MTPFFEVKIKVLPGQEEKLGDKKLTAGLPAEVWRVDLGARGVWFRVTLQDRFEDLESADSWRDVHPVWRKILANDGL